MNEIQDIKLDITRFVQDLKIIKFCKNSAPYFIFVRMYVRVYVYLCVRALSSYLSLARDLKKLQCVHLVFIYFIILFNYRYFNSRLYSYISM